MGGGCNSPTDRCADVGNIGMGRRFPNGYIYHSHLMCNYRRRPKTTTPPAKTRPAQCRRPVVLQRCPLPVTPVVLAAARWLSPVSCYPLSRRASSTGACRPPAWSSRSSPRTRRKRTSVLVRVRRPSTRCAASWLESTAASAGPASPAPETATPANVSRCTPYKPPTR